MDRTHPDSTPPAFDAERANLLQAAQILSTSIEHGLNKSGVISPALLEWYVERCTLDLAQGESASVRENLAKAQKRRFKL